MHYTVHYTIQMLAFMTSANDVGVKATYAYSFMSLRFFLRASLSAVEYIRFRSCWFTCMPAAPICKQYIRYIRAGKRTSIAHGARRNHTSYNLPDILSHSHSLH